MSGNTNTEIVNMTEFYVEVHHTRGNVSKFEYLGLELDDNENDEFTVGTMEPVELDVWEFRRRSHEHWHVGFAMDEVMQGAARFRVTRYPDLEKDMVDAPYHPSVESWHIDPEKVSEHFYG